MSKLKWDQTAERLYETGVKKCVLFPQASNGTYETGVAWSGITAISESPSGAEETALWADDIKYLSLRSTEEFGGSIEAYTFPDEWGECDGSVEVALGAFIGQQTRKAFGLCYRTTIGNDTLYEDYGYKIHFVWNATASPSSRDYSTINDSPEAISFSWEFTTTPVNITGHKDMAWMVVDSTKADPELLLELEAVIYGTNSTNSRLPSPDEVVRILTPKEWHVDGANLSTARRSLAAVTNGSYALFAGGEFGNRETFYSAIDAYNASLTRNNSASLTRNKADLAAATVGDYALFVGGWSEGHTSESELKSTDAFNKNLVRYAPSPLIHKGKSNSAAGSSRNYAIFAGGFDHSGGTTNGYVDAFDASLTCYEGSSVYTFRNKTGTSLNGCALFHTSDGISVIDDSLTNSFITISGYNGEATNAVSIGDHAMFTSGYMNAGINNFPKEIYTLDKLFTVSHGQELSHGRIRIAAAANNSYAAFAGGDDRSSIAYDTVDIFNASLTRLSSSNVKLSNAKTYLAGAAIGDYLLFGGGSTKNYSTTYSTVDAIGYY